MVHFKLRFDLGYDLGIRPRDTISGFDLGICGIVDEPLITWSHTPIFFIETQNEGKIM